MADLVSGEVSLRGFQTASCLLPVSHLVETVIALVSFLFIRALFHHEGHTLMTSSKHYFPKAPSLNTITLGIRASTYEFGEDTVHSIEDR